VGRGVGTTNSRKAGVGKLVILTNEVGRDEGEPVGFPVTNALGEADGVSVGTIEGTTVGSGDGTVVGLALGDVVG